MSELDWNEIVAVLNSVESSESGIGVEEVVNNDYVLDISNSINPPYLEILEQPQEYCGFRYRTEFKKNVPYAPLTGERSVKQSKTYPTVQLINYQKPAIIRCWLCLNKNKDVHIHQLARKNQIEPHDVVVDAGNNFTAIFEGLSIISSKIKDQAYLRYFHQKKCHLLSGYDLKLLAFEERCVLKEIKKLEALEKNRAFLFFEAFDLNTHEKIAEVFSNEIKNSRNSNFGVLKIAKQSVLCGPVLGNTEVMIFVEKVTTGVKVVFFELNSSKEIIWEAEATIVEYWHQYGIIFRTPTYKDLAISEERIVFFRLVRDYDGSHSNDMIFYYQPDNKLNYNYLEPCAGKKRRLVETGDYSLVPSESLVAFNGEQAEVIDGNLVVTNAQVHNAEETDPFENISVFNLPFYIGHDGTNDSEDVQVFTDSATIVRKRNELDVSPDDFELARKLFQLTVGDELSVLEENIRNFSSKLDLNELRNVYQKTLAHIAVENKKFSHVQSLINAGIDVNSLDDNRNSVLHLAVLHNADAKTVSFLLSKGADIYLNNNDAETPLHMACRLGRKVHVEFFLPYLCKYPCVSLNTGDTPLHVAVKFGHLDLIDVLLQRFSPLSLNKAGYSPIESAVYCENVDMVKLILSGMNPDETRNILLTWQLEKSVQNEMVRDILAEYLGKSKYSSILSDKTDYEFNKISSDFNSKCLLKE